MYYVLQIWIVYYCVFRDDVLIEMFVLRLHSCGHSLPMLRFVLFVVCVLLYKVFSMFCHSLWHAIVYIRAFSSCLYRILISFINLRVDILNIELFQLVKHYMIIPHF